MRMKLQRIICWLFVASMNLPCYSLGTKLEIFCASKDLCKKISDSTLILESDGLIVGRATLINAPQRLFISPKIDNEKSLFVGILSDGSRIFLKKAKYDSITRLVLLKAEEGSLKNLVPAEVARKPLILGDNVYFLSESKLVNGSCTALKRPARLETMQFAPMAEILLEEKSIQNLSPSLAFDQTGSILGVLAAKAGFKMNERRQKALLQLDQQAKRKKNSSLIENSAIVSTSQDFVYMMGAPVIQRVISGFCAPDHKPKHPTIGAFFRNIANGQRRGVWIESVLPGLPAEQGGLKAGDIVVQVGEKYVYDAIDMASMLFEQTIGTILKFGVHRNSRAIQLNIMVGAQD